MNIIIFGKIIKGDGYGKHLGFPTANLERRQFVRLKSKPRMGIWAGTGIISNFKFQISNEILKPKGIKVTWYKAAIVIGPVDKTGLPKIEAHLIGFKGNLYGKRIMLHLKKYIRPFKKFSNTDQLKRQIRKDVEKVKAIKMYV